MLQAELLIFYHLCVVLSLEHGLPRKEICKLNFFIEPHYISHKIKYASSLTVVSLLCNNKIKLP